MGNGQPLKILIFDDEKGIVENFQEIYSRRGFITFGALDGITALEIFKKERPQICLIDVELPWVDVPLDGIEVLKRIKDIDKDTYCIMMGPYPHEDSLQQAKDLGALQFLIKPFTLDILDKYIEEIKSLIAKKKSSIRKLFHGLGSSLHLITIGIGATKEFIEECLKEDNDIPQRAKEKISNCLKDLDRIVSSAKEADRKTREIEEQVYKAIDPDTGKPKES